MRHLGAYSTSMSGKWVQHLQPSLKEDELSGGNQTWVKVPKFRVVELGET